MHGAGNDYIYVNTLLYDIPDPSAAAIQWSAPHFGVGSDGLVLIGKPTIASGADYSMRIFNADGTEAMMCGNASRCIGKYLYEKGLTDKVEIKLETKSGVKILHLHVDDDNKVKTVTVDMLEPQLNVPEQYIGGKIEGTFVSMGNPHFVIFVDDITKTDVAEEGHRLEFDKAFPQRCNIEFAQVVGDNKLRTRVWERGSGITMACGTGACATAVAAALKGFSKRASDIVMDGGTLHIEWNEKDNHVYMTGPAEFAFEGEIALP
jgi:diaminopimelate epimerase